jgi:hypothetical protein
MEHHEISRHGAIRSSDLADEAKPVCGRKGMRETLRWKDGTWANNLTHMVESRFCA